VIPEPKSFPKQLAIMNNFPGMTPPLGGLGGGMGGIPGGAPQGMSEQELRMIKAVSSFNLAQFIQLVCTVHAEPSC